MKTYPKTRNKKTKVSTWTQILKVRRTLKKIKINKHTLLINLQFFFVLEGKSNSLGRCVRVCVFSIGSAADVETGRVGFVGWVQMSTLLRIIYSKPDFYCWPNDINSVKLFTWEKIILTKLLKISSHGTIFFFFFAE